MRPSQLQKDLESGEALTGLFAPVGAEFETPGILSWSSQAGAVLRLADLSHDWPNDFDTGFTVHGWLHSHEPVTLMDTFVRGTTAFRQTERLTSLILALGEHTDLDECWTYANYCPTGLHEWYPENGLSMEEERTVVRVEWRPVEAIATEVPGAKITLQPGSDWSWSGPASPEWHIDTSMRFSVQADDPLTIEEYWRRYGSSLLGFVVFATDRPDDLAWESFYCPDNKRRIVLLRGGRKSYDRDWRLNDGHCLFRAKDVGDIPETLTKWLSVWGASEPSLGLYIETIQQGLDYSPPRFLTLYIAAEGYWRGTQRQGENKWGVDALALRGGIDETVSKVDKAARALIGVLRNYHVHLSLPASFSPERVGIDTYESTRRLHVLMQACLLREIGMDTKQIERLIVQHYRSWEIP